MIKPSTTRVLSGLLALGVASAALDGVVLAPSALSRSRSAVELRLRRSPGRVDVVIAGLGTEVRVVRQNQLDGRWSARLTGVDLGDRPFTPQQTVLSSSELLSVRLEPLESDLQLIVKARMGERVPTPTIGSNSDSLVVSFSGLMGPEQRSSGRLDLRRPGRVAQPVMAPPMRARASAPPLGDIAVGTMLINNRSFVNASGPPVSLTLNKAPAKDALMSLARLGGYGFVFVGDSDNLMGPESDGSEYPVTMTFRGERYDRALNSVLMASGLQGRLDGSTLLVGTAVSAKSFGPQMSKVFRLNQVDVESAGSYLGNLGAAIQFAKTTTTTSRESETSGTSSNSSESSTSSTSTTTEVDTYGSGVGPLLGLVGTTDARLNTITLVGDPKLISVAERYLRQIDLRKRQVAVKVQIMSIDLLNDKSIDASFSSRIGNTFILSDSGKAIVNFGTEPGVDPSAPISADQADSAFVEQKRVVPPFVEKLDDVRTYIDDNGNVVVVETPFIDPVTKQRVYVPDSNPNASAQLVPVYDELGRPVYVPNSNPARGQKNGFSYPTNSLDGYLEAAIDSSSAKTLASPTLLVQEGEEAQVETGTSVITGVSSTETANGSTQFENTRENAGLTLDLTVHKIDDNGFVTMNVNPSVSIPQPAGTQLGVPIFNITARSLNSGSIRLRDRQTLVLTGVIQDNDREIVRKWPILGDMPFIGQLFRSSDSQREKQELVILVTPSIIDDQIGGSYGYGYRPSTKEARQLMGSS